MNLSRREVVKQLLFVSVSASLMPACFLDKQKAGISLKHMHINKDQEATFASLFDTIIPETETPGAISVHADLFAWKLIDDCKPLSDQEKIVKGINELNLYSQKDNGQFFNQASLIQRQQMIAAIEHIQEKNQSLFEFYQMAKNLAIAAYTGSEYFMTKVQVYEQIPGRFHGCVKA